MDTQKTPPIEAVAPTTGNLPWVKCVNCKRTITLPAEWRAFRVNLSETARIVLSVHQRRCTKKN